MRQILIAGLLLAGCNNSPEPQRMTVAAIRAECAEMLAADLDATERQCRARWPASVPAGNVASLCDRDSIISPARAMLDRCYTERSREADRQYTREWGRWNARQWRYTGPAPIGSALNPMAVRLVP